MKKLITVVQAALNNYKTCLYWIVLIVLIALLFITFQQRDEYLAKYKSTTELRRLDSLSFDKELTTWKDVSGNEHKLVERYSIENGVFRSYVDSMSHVLSVNSKQISSLTQINQELVIKNQQLSKDSVHIKYVYYKDSTGKPDSIAQIQQIDFSWPSKSFVGKRWIDITGSVGEKNVINISGTDSLAITNYWKRTWLLGPKHLYTDVSNRNPYITISGVRSVESGIAEPRWLIAPSVQLSYQLGTGQIRLLPGVSLIYYPLSFKIK